MQVLDVHEAEAHLADFVKAAAAGEPFRITVDGREMVEVRAIGKASSFSPSIIDRGDADRTLGALEGQAVLPEDFDRYMEDEILEMFGLND